MYRFLAKKAVVGIERGSDLAKKSSHVWVITCILGAHERKFSQVVRRDTSTRNTRNPQLTLRNPAFQVLPVAFWTW